MTQVAKGAERKATNSVLERWQKSFQREGGVGGNQKKPRNSSGELGTSGEDRSGCILGTRG
jgi:hypothetical protein